MSGRSILQTRPAPGRVQVDAEVKLSTVRKVPSGPYECREVSAQEEVRRPKVRILFWPVVCIPLVQATMESLFDETAGWDFLAFSGGEMALASIASLGVSRQ